MELNKVYVEFTANLQLDLHDVEVLNLLAGPYSLSEWITKTYHIKLPKKQIDETLHKLQKVTYQILELRKEMMKVKIDSESD